MAQEFNNYFNILTKLYEESCQNAHIKGSKGFKQHMLKYNTQAFTRWFHSTLVKGTLLSPANVFSLISGQTSGSNLYPTLSIHSKTGSGYSMKFGTASFSLDGHPAVKDFRIFLEAISPTVDVTQNGLITPQMEASLLKQMSVKDSFYMEYFMVLVKQMKLLVKVRGIHINRLTVTEAFHKLLLKSNREIFDIMVQESVKLCRFYVMNLIPGYNMPLEDEFFIELLQKPSVTQDILNQIYSLLLNSFESMQARGIEFEISSPQFNSPQHSSELTSADLYQLFASGSYILHALLIKYFYTVFGNYLRLITPFYSELFNFRDYSKLILMENTPESIGAYFVPYSHYSLTAFGMEYFKLNLSPSENKAIETNIPIEELMKYLSCLSVSSGVKTGTLGSLTTKHAKPSNIKAYQLKIILEYDEDLWKSFEVADYYTLEQLHRLICENFFLDPFCEYNFNTDKELNPFTRYTPPDDKSRFKKTNLTLLKDLPLQEKDCFYYTQEQGFMSMAYSDKASDHDVYIIEIKKIKNPAGIELYPRVLRESSTLKELSLFMDIDY